MELEILGFVICNKDQKRLFTKGKIYPYFMIEDISFVEDTRIQIMNDNEEMIGQWMFLDDKSKNTHYFDFYHYPEFPEDINQWTEEDWFQYHLKYGE